jgi:sugar/nucleoside kinase (ribokinase family)
MTTRPSGQVLAIGEYLIDLIATGEATSLLDVECLAVRPGGAPANVAVALSRQGVNSALCAVVGQDPFGERLLAVLDANGVDRTRVRQDPRVDTTLALAWKDARGDGHFRLLRQADIQLDVDDLNGAGIEAFDAIVIGSVSLSHQPSRTAIEHAVAVARANDVAICFDANIRPSIWISRDAVWTVCEPILSACTLLKLSMDDARYLFELEQDATPDDVMESVGRYGCPFVVITDGSRGAWFSSGSSGRYSPLEFVPAYQVDAVEPTGAGDAFVAAIITRLLGNEWNGLATEDVRYASAAGALTTTRAGAIDSLPTASEIQEFLDARAG